MLVKNMYKALVLGEVCIDVIIFNPSSIPVFGIPLWAEDTQILLGGSASLTSQGLNALDVDVRINSYSGKDWIIEQLLSELEQKGINCDTILRNELIKTPICTCAIKQGRKEFISCSPFSPYPLELMDAELENEDLFYFGGLLLYPELWEGDLARFINRAKSHALIVVDTQILPCKKNIYLKRALTKENLGQVDVLLLNRNECQILTGSDNLLTAGKFLASFGPKIIVVKLGSEGAFVVNGENSFYCESHSEDVYNPVGAGDLFGAAFSFGLLNNWTLQKAVAFANAYASMAISRKENRYPNFTETINAIQLTNDN